MKNAITSSKTCFKCSQTKPITEFYKHSAMGDGHLGKCKVCAKADANKHRLENIDKIREYDKERGRSKERIAAAAKHAKHWREQDKRRAISHNKVAYAIRKGNLVKSPCCVCGSSESMAHHESYDRPLDVVWYCQIHHKERHKIMAIEGIDP